MSDERFVLDASALLAMLGREPGGDMVATVIAVGVVSAVNWSEVLQKSWAHGVDIDGLREDIESLGVEIVPFGTDEAAVTADLWHQGGRNLAMADRACLATAAVHGLTVLTADRAWASLDFEAEVRVIR